MSIKLNVWHHLLLGAEEGWFLELEGDDGHVPG